MNLSVQFKFSAAKIKIILFTLANLVWVKLQSPMVLFNFYNKIKFEFFRHLCAVCGHKSGFQNHIILNLQKQKPRLQAALFGFFRKA